MWRLTTLLQRKAGLSPEAFGQRLFSDFTPALTAALRDDKRLVRLIANVRPVDLDAEVADIFPARYDGMLEFWFNSSADAAAALRDLSGNQKLRDAAAPLIDASKSVAWIAEVFPQKPEKGDTRIKFMAGGGVAAGWSVEDAQKYWRDVHPVVAQTAPKVWEPLTRYTQFHGKDVPGLDTNWLAAYRFVPLSADMGFRQGSDFIKNYTSDEYMAIVRPDEEKFSLPGEMLAFVSGEERELIGGR